MKKWFSIFVLLVTPAWGQEAESVGQNYSEIRVGVRYDAAPFSYRIGSERSSNIDDYSGYVVEVCKEILGEIRRTSPFKDAALTAVEVKAGDRFKPLAADGDIDLLCGPTSITADRLSKYNISMPVYLTGVAFAKLNSDEGGPFPTSYVCNTPLVGFVANTTAEFPGTLEMAKEGFFGRFSKPVEQILTEADQVESGGYSIDSLDDWVGRDLEASIFGKTCTETFSVPPIKVFKDHNTGLKAFCENEVIYYVADVDIIGNYILENSEMCDVELNRSVIFIENYGIFFRTYDSFDDVNDPTDFAKTQLLFSMFSRKLLERLRVGEGVFERAYKSAFNERKRTEALDNFIRGSSFGLR